VSLQFLPPHSYEWNPPVLQAFEHWFALVVAL